MGMAIAAGESPQAITNISKGVLATIDNFTADDKEKRAYKRQVAMSAAKYGLENVRRDRVELAAIAKEKRTPFNKIFNATEDFTYNGKDYKVNDMVIASMGSIQDGSFPLNKVQDQDLTIAGLKAQRSKLTANLQLAKASMSDPSKFTKPMTQYINASTQVKGNIAIQELLKQAVVPLQAGAVTGGWNALQAYGQRLENLTGSQWEEYKKTDAWTDYLAEGREQIRLSERGPFEKGIDWFGEKLADAKASPAGKGLSLAATGLDAYNKYLAEGPEDPFYNPMSPYANSMLTDVQQPGLEGLLFTAQDTSPGMSPNQLAEMYITGSGSVRPSGPYDSYSYAMQQPGYGYMFNDYLADYYS